jgi:hypothetical protein
LVACALSLARTPDASAQQDGPLRVHWSAPENCADGEQVEALIRSHIGHIEAGAVDVDVQVIRKNPTAYTVLIRLGGALTGERHLDAESCEAAVEATALLIAIAVDAGHNAAAPTGPPLQAQPPEAKAPAATDTSDAGATSETTVGPTTADPPVAMQTADGGRPEESPDHAIITTESDGTPTIRFELGGGVAIDWGSTPAVTSGGMLSAALSIDRVLLTLNGTVLLPRDSAIAPRASLSASWISAAMSGCYLFGGAIQWGPCGGVETGMLSTTTRGLRTTDTVSETVIYTTGSVVGRAQLTPTMYAAIWLSMRTPVWYPRLVVDGVGEVFRPAILGARASVVFTLVLG